ncbi:MAG: protease inhibitor I42 family protein [bacterium]
MEESDTISIILASNPYGGYQWVLDTDEIDEDIVEKQSRQFYLVQTNSYMEQWIFKGIDIGTTNIKLEYTSSSGSVSSTFEVSVEVE